MSCFCLLRFHSSFSVFLFSFHPWIISCLFIIYFESKIHLFWQMLVLGQRPKLSLIFWIVMQDLWFILCCQTNKIVHLAHRRIILSPQRDVIVELVFYLFFFCSFRKEGHWFLPEIVRLTSRAKALSYKLRCSSRVVFKYCREMNWGWIPGMFGWCNHKNNGRHISKDWASFASGALV